MKPTTIHQTIFSAGIVLLAIGASIYKSSLCWYLLHGFYWVILISGMLIAAYGPPKDKPEPDNSTYIFTIIQLAVFAYLNLWTLFFILIVIKAIVAPLVKAKENA